MNLTLNYERKNFWNHYDLSSDTKEDGTEEDALKAFKFICTNRIFSPAALFCGKILFSFDTVTDWENGIVTVEVMRGRQPEESKKMSTAKARKYIKELFAEEEKETGAAE